VQLHDKKKEEKFFFHTKETLNSQPKLGFGKEGSIAQAYLSKRENEKRVFHAKEKKVLTNIPCTGAKFQRKKGGSDKATG